MKDEYYLKQHYDEHFTGDIELRGFRYGNVVRCELTVTKIRVPYQWWVEVVGEFETDEDLLNELKKPEYINRGTSEAII